MQSFLSTLASLWLIAPSLQTTLPRTVYEFPNPTWLENIFATRNGSLLTGIIGSPELHLINPNSNTSTNTLIYTFPTTTAVFGITELIPDVFAVAVGNFSYQTLESDQGSYSVWNLDLRDGSSPEVTKISDIPDGILLNGVTSLNNHTVLIADSRAGTVVRLDTETKEHSVAIDDPSMKIPEDADLQIGINGVKVRGEYLYFSNSAQSTFNRVKIGYNGAAEGSVENLASNITVPDDFEVADDGTAFVARVFDNVIDRITLDGTVETAFGNLNSSDVGGATSVTLGRTYKDRNVAYVCTNGAIGQPVNGTFTEGGKIVAFEIN